MAIPVPESFGEYSKSIFIFPIIIWSYIIYSTKNLFFFVPLIAYVFLFFYYIFWFEKTYLRKIESKNKLFDIFTVIAIISLNPYYLGSLLSLIFLTNVINDYIALFLLVFAFLGYLYWAIKTFVIAKPSIKETFNFGTNIGEISKKIVKERPKGKIDVEYFKRSISENIDKLKIELKNKEKRK